jgi:hypothetical protein
MLTTLLCFSIVLNGMTCIEKLRTVIKWLQINSFTLNAEKTNYMTFTINKATQPNLNIIAHTCTFSHNYPDICNCTKIKKVYSTKYLGIIIDQHLSWYPQLEAVSNRAKKLIWIFKYLRNVTDNLLLTNIYISLVQSILLYCIAIWGGACKSKFISIERAQRSILKVMFKKKRLFSTAELYKDANILTVRQLYILQCVLKIHKSTPVNPKVLNKRNPMCITCAHIHNKFRYAHKHTHSYK